MAVHRKPHRSSGCYNAVHCCSMTSYSACAAEHNSGVNNSQRGILQQQCVAKRRNVQQYQCTSGLCSVQQQNAQEGQQQTHLPARSTKLRAPCKLWPEVSCRPVMYRVNTEWLLEETAFMAVDSTARAAAAFLTKASAAVAQLMGSLVAP